LKIIVINNHTLGMIRQLQDNYFNSRYQSTYWGYSAPDFSLIGEAYGIESKTIHSTQMIDTALDWLWKEDGKPSLLQVIIEMHANVYPKIAFGKPITEMEPYSKSLEMENT
jgi:acetolactate synthase-1/2/3 large subunit